MTVFNLTPEQEIKFKTWAKEQPLRHYRAAGDSGCSPYIFSFQETNVGLIVKVKHEDTGAELDLTDYDSF